MGDTSPKNKEKRRKQQKDRRENTNPPGSTPRAEKDKAPPKA